MQVVRCLPSFVCEQDTFTLSFQYGVVQSTICIQVLKRIIENDKGYSSGTVISLGSLPSVFKLSSLLEDARKSSSTPYLLPLRTPYFHIQIYSIKPETHCSKASKLHKKQHSPIGVCVPAQLRRINDRANLTKAIHKHISQTHTESNGLNQE
jgi:spore coat polysaccharide biosynthesis protein SpsF (cytidylyltransferase family)